MSDFFDTSELDELINEINDVAEGLEMAPDAIESVLREYIQKWRANAPMDTGALKRSIRLIAQGGRYGISMLDYGFYQNFGVRGTQDNLGLAVPSWSPLPPSRGAKYSFSKRRFGLPAQKFFLTTDEDLTDLVDEIFSIIEKRILE